MVKICSVSGRVKNSKKTYKKITGPDHDEAHSSIQPDLD